MGRKILKIAGQCYLLLAFAVILVSYASVAYFHGLGALFDMLSPFNVLNEVVVFLTLAPGLLALYFSR